MHIVVKWTNEPLQFRCAIETFINEMEDFAFGMDCEDEMRERLTDTLNELGIDYELEADDV